MKLHEIYEAIGEVEVEPKQKRGMGGIHSSRNIGDRKILTVTTRISKEREKIVNSYIARGLAVGLSPTRRSARKAAQRHGIFFNALLEAEDRKVLGG